MKEKIQEALKTRWGNQLGIKDEKVFEGVAASVQTLITSDEQLTQFVEGAKDLLTQHQSYADKVRTELTAKIKGLEGEKADLEAKLNGNNPPKPNPEPKPQDIPADMAKIITEAVANAIKPISEELAGFKAAKAIDDTIATVNTRIDAWGYGKGYPKEMEKAQKNAMELYEAYGKKWTADELEAKIKEKFNQEVYDKGLDTNKPYESDGGGNEKTDFSSFDRAAEKLGWAKPGGQNK